MKRIWQVLVEKWWEIDEQQDTSRDHDSRPHPETARDGHKEESAGDQRPPLKGGRTFRVRGVPLEWDIARLQSFLVDQNDSSGLIVRSLAHEIHGRSYTATVSFQNVTRPVQTDQAGDSWLVDLPADSTHHTRPPQKLILDDGFLGITTLHAPPGQYHKVE